MLAFHDPLASTYKTPEMPINLRILAESILATKRHIPATKRHIKDKVG